MKLNQKLLSIILIAICSLLVLPNSAFATNNSNKKSDKKSKVIIFSLPRLTWSNLKKAHTPNIDKLIDSGSVAAMSVRTLGPITTPAEGYATISAGSRAAVDQSNDSNFVAGNEIYDGNLGTSIYKDENISTPKGVFAAYGLGFDISKQLNQKGLNNSRIGSFANALESKDKSIAVFGNADHCSSDKPDCFQRAVAYVGSNSKGIMANGDITRDLLNVKSEDTSRLTTNYEVLAQKVVDGISKNDVVVSECSDLERIESDRSTTTSSKSNKDYIDAVNKCDLFIGRVMKSVDLQKDQVFVLSASSPKSTEQTTVFIAAGKSVKQGYAASSTTRREGIVTLVDVAPSILKFLKVPLPKSMGQTFFDFKINSETSLSRVNNLVKLNSQAIIRDKSVAGSTVLLILLVVFGSLIAMVAYTRARSWRNFARFLALMALPIPSLGFLLKPFTISIASSLNFIIIFLITSTIFAYLAMLIAKKITYVKIILAIASINILVQLVDIIFSGSLQLNSVFGYSPVVAGRFSGFGNLAFAIFAMSAVVFVAMVKELSKSKPNWNIKKMNIILISFMVVILIIDGAPYFGSDVGGVLAITPTIFLIGLMLFDKKVSIKALLVSAVVTLATIVTFAFIDLARPAEERTHLGRFASSLVRGQAGIIVERKITANINILTGSVWAVTIIIALLYFSFLFLHPEMFLHRTSAKHPGFKFLTYPGLLLGILGMVLNDSGVAIPGMMIAIVLPAVVLMSLGVADEDSKKLEKV